jgi:hypothetical protein
MSRPHQIGRRTRGHPLLWLVVLATVGAYTTWTAVESVGLAVSVARTNGWAAGAWMFVWTAIYAGAGPALLYYAARVARLCWRMYAPTAPFPPGHCRRCGYNLTGNVSGACPECGAVARRPTRA